MEIKEIGLLLVKSEGTYGTDAVPTGVNAIPTIGDSLTYEVQSTAVARKLQDGTQDSLAGYNAQTHVTLKFQCELRGNRTDGVAADISSGSSAHAVEIDPLLQAANLTPTYSAESGSGTRDGAVFYYPKVITGIGSSVTCYWYTGLKLHSLVGGKVDFKVTFEAGKIPMIEFTVMGKYGGVTDASIPSPTFLATKPPLWEAGGLNLGAYTSLIASKIDFSMGNTLTLRKSGMDLDGNAGVAITSYTAKGTMDPESFAVATNPIWADWYAAALLSLNVYTTSNSGNIVTLLDSAVELKKVTYGTRDKLIIHQVEFDLSRPINFVTPSVLGFS